MYNRSSKRKSEIDNRVQALFEEMCVCVCVCVCVGARARMRVGTCSFSLV